jgi:hypothetical protein
VSRVYYLFDPAWYHLIMWNQSAGSKLYTTINTRGVIDACVMPPRHAEICIRASARLESASCINARVTVNVRKRTRAHLDAHTCACTCGIPGAPFHAF